MNENEIWSYLSLHHSRLLSQLDRDPDSPSFGSFDRNYWNYKIRDFSSIILQQGILYLDVLYSYNNSNNYFFRNDVLKSWIKGGVNFWCKSQLKTGAFNEYYPNESGFPPTSFSLYAICLIVHKYPELQTNDVIYAINKAIKWILKKREYNAINQESAALAAITIAKKINGVVISSEIFTERLHLFYKSQSSEGWFNEYDGPDLGYLSVTIDSLWDIFQFSKDERAKIALEKAVGFIYDFISISGHLPIMINSRNTDYIVPYGLSGFASQNIKAAKIASFILNNLNKEDSIFSKTDDRYLSHYIGQSFLRSINNLNNLNLNDSICFQNNFEIFYKDCGIFIKHIPDIKSIYISANKGGIINVFNKNSIEFVDYGWRYRENNRIATTHWQSKDNVVSYSDSEIHIKGNFIIQSFIRPSLFKHILLRLISILIGNKLIPILKSKFIFSEKKTKALFHRRIKINKSEVIIDDKFENIDINKLYKSKQYSLRHVSSANRFNNEEVI